MNITTATAQRPLKSPASPDFISAVHIAGAVRLTDVKPENTRWLWPGRIPLGRVTLLVSDPGLGKSLLTLDIAARVSTGAPWPDHRSRHTPCAVTELPNAPNSEVLNESPGNVAQPSANAADGTRSVPATFPPSSVLLLTAEDDLADTIRPRLEALGADCERILAISSIPGENAQDVPRAFALNRDLARLNNLLDALPDCRLLIIDPISAFLGGTNEHANADVRTLLAALATLARDRGIAVIIVSHLRKKAGAAIHRTIGSLAFVAAARAAWVICKDHDDPNKRYFLPIKNNLAPDVTGLAFTIETSPDGLTPVISWLPTAEKITAEIVIGNARSVGRPDDERQHAINWLRERLAKGSRPVRDLKQEADAFGISYGTLRRAFRNLDGEAVRQGTFPFGQWNWKLPGVDAQNAGGEYCAPRGFPDDFEELWKQWLPTPEEKAQRHKASQAAQ